MTRSSRGAFAAAGLVLAMGISIPSWSSAADAGPRLCGEPIRTEDWPMSGHDLSGTRSQPDESNISRDNVGSLRPIWTFDTGHRSSGMLPSDPDDNQVPNIADINSTPVEAGGCLYFGTAFASNDPHDPGYPNLFALDIATSDPNRRVVWSRHLDVGPKAGVGGDIVGSPAVVGNLLYVLVNEYGNGSTTGPHAMALNRRTGATVWTSAPFVTDVCPGEPRTLTDGTEVEGKCAGAYTNASPVVADGVLIAGFSAAEGDPDGHGGYALIDADSGAVLSTTFTIPPSEWITTGPGGCDGNEKDPSGEPVAPGERCGGGGIWTTPAVDPASGYAYMGTGNPYSKKSEHPLTNSIIKVDIDRSRATFGQIVGSYKGNIDQSTEAVHAVSENTTCQVLPDDQIRQPPPGPVPYDERMADLQGELSDSHGCVQLDLDFGAAPNLFRDARGNLVVGDLQKSGVYHVVDASTMAPAWKSVLSVSCNLCNGASTALDPDGGAIYAAVAPGNLSSAWTGDDLTVRTGNEAYHLPRWATPFGDVIHYEGVSVANGVVYSIETDGFLDALDAETGRPLLHRFVSGGMGDGAEYFPLASAGPAIARGVVFVPAGNHLIAYQVGS